MQGPWSGQYSSALALAPSDTALVNCRAIYVGGAGNITIVQGPIGSPETAVTFTAVPVGTILPVEINGGLVKATGTTATLLVALA
jgi:hypothetical protein